MNKLKILSLVLLVCLLPILGCSKNDNSEEKKYNLNATLGAIQEQGVVLNSYGITGKPITLNKVVPDVSAIESSDTEDPEFIYIYVFENEKLRKTGDKEFDNQMKNSKFTTFPMKYETGNILVIYWSQSKEKPQYDVSFKTAIEKLGGTS